MTISCFTNCPPILDPSVPNILGQPIPAPFLRVLDVVRSMAPSAVLAGGALRDIAWGWPPKDLDIFIPNSESAHIQGVHEKILFGPPVYGGYVSGDGEVLDVYEAFTGETDTPIQVIVLNTSFTGQEFAQHAIERMDFDACQIGYSPALRPSGFVFTDEAIAALEGRYMNLLRVETAESVIRSFRRVQRFEDRYQGAIRINTERGDKFLIDHGLLSDH